jgi:ribonuclease-3
MDPAAPAQSEPPHAESSRLDVATYFELSPTSPLFEQALTHPSFANEQPGVADNQRLEFLGDAVLGLCVSALVFERMPEADEGALTRMRAELVKASSLCTFGVTHGVPAALRFGKGAGEAQLRHNQNVVADAVEALIAAAYLEGGFAQARRCCDKIAEYGLARGAQGALDPKSALQELVQALGWPAPSYVVVATDGPSHAPKFRVEVLVAATVLGTGEGRAKRDAERNAAQSALSAETWRALGENAGGPPKEGQGQGSDGT